MTKTKAKNRKRAPAVAVQRVVRRIVNTEKRKVALEKAINREYVALAKLVIPKCEKAIGRPLRTPRDLMDWMRKNQPEIKALDTTPGENWEYRPANRMLFGAYA